MIYVITYILFTALGNIFLHYIGLKMPSMLLVLISTSYAIIYFHAINVSQLSVVYKRIMDVKSSYFLLSIFMLLMWLGSFLIPIYFLPSIHLISFMSITAVCGICAIYYVNRNLKNLIKLSLLMINLLAFYIVSSFYYHGWHLLILILGTMLTGLSGYGYILTSARLNKHNFSTTQILAVRFWLLWLTALIYVIVNKQFSSMSLNTFIETFLVSILTLILPIYFSQKAIEKIGGNQTSIWIGFTPLTTFIFEKIFIKISFNYTGIFAVILAMLLLFYSFFLSNVKAKNSD